MKEEEAKKGNKDPQDDQKAKKKQLISKQ